VLELPFIINASSFVKVSIHQIFGKATPFISNLKDLDGFMS
jgi:hypothetical protein